MTVSFQIVYVHCTFTAISKVPIKLSFKWWSVSRNGKDSVSRSWWGALNLCGINFLYICSTDAGTWFLRFKSYFTPFCGLNRLWDFSLQEIFICTTTESALDTTFQYFSRPKTFSRLVFDHRAAVVVLWPCHTPSGVSLWHMCLMNCTRPITIWGNYYYHIRTLAGKNNWRRQCKKH